MAFQVNLHLPSLFFTNIQPNLPELSLLQFLFLQLTYHAEASVLLQDDF